MSHQLKLVAFVFPLNGQELKISELFFTLLKFIAFPITFGAYRLFLQRRFAKELKGKIKSQTKS